MTVDREPDFDLAYESDPDEVDQPSVTADEDPLVEPMELPATIHRGSEVDEADALDQALEVDLGEDEDL